MVFIACLGRSLQYLCPYRNSHHKGRVWTSEGKFLLGTTLTPWIYIFLMLHTRLIFYSIILQQQKKDCWRTIYTFDKALEQGKVRSKHLAQLPSDVFGWNEVQASRTVVERCLWVKRHLGAHLNPSIAHLKWAPNFRKVTKCNDYHHHKGRIWSSAGKILLF